MVTWYFLEFSYSFQQHKKFGISVEIGRSLMQRSDPILTFSDHSVYKNNLKNGVFMLHE